MKGTPEPEGLPLGAALVGPRPEGPRRNQVGGPVRPQTIWVRVVAGCQLPQKYLQERKKLAAGRHQLESRAQ